jgi:hypothetical protein
MKDFFSGKFCPFQVWKIIVMKVAQRKNVRGFCLKKKKI